MLSKKRTTQASTLAIEDACRDYFKIHSWSETCTIPEDVRAAGMACVETSSLNSEDRIAFGELYAITYKDEIALLTAQEKARQSNAGDEMHVLRMKLFEHLIIAVRQEHLSLQECRVIQLRFALADGIWYSQQQVASQLAITRGRVHTFGDRALRWLLENEVFMEQLRLYMRHLSLLPQPWRDFIAAFTQSLGISPNQERDEKK